MSVHGRKAADEALIQALACGATVESAAQKAQVSKRTAYRRLKDPEFAELDANIKVHAPLLLNCLPEQLSRHGPRVE